MSNLKLKHVTFSGIDKRTDLSALQEIQREHPYVEWGVLLSRSWNENGNRYVDPAWLKNLEGLGLNLSGHLCGSLAHDAVRGSWPSVREFLQEHTPLFSRFQLNISNRDDNPAVVHLDNNISQEIIIQQPHATRCRLFLDSWSYYGDPSRYKPLTYRPLSMLIDGSGGCGIDARIVDFKDKNYKVGYAGGINPDNVAIKLSHLLYSPNVGDFWIDMESGVRTNDCFDINKVRNVLSICQKVIEQYLTI